MIPFPGKINKGVMQNSYPRFIPDHKSVGFNHKAEGAQPCGRRINPSLRI
jgi:hypothetical protein